MAKKNDAATNQPVAPERSQGVEPVHEHTARLSEEMARYNAKLRREDAPESAMGEAGLSTSTPKSTPVVSDTSSDTGAT